MEACPLANTAYTALAEYIAAVKADTVAPALEKEFFTRCGNVGNDS